MEERVAQQNPFTSHSAAISAKMREQEEIDRHRKEFLRRGGKVDVISSPDYKPKAADDLSIKLREQFDRGRSRSQKNTSKKKRKYIRFKGTKSPQVIINKKYIGAYATEADAVAARDQYLIDNNLPPAGD
jgi:glutaredoxin